MVRGQLERRISALEQSKRADERRWHQIVTDSGESLEDARARYEAAKGPIGKDGLIIWRVIVAPHRSHVIV